MNKEQATSNDKTTIYRVTLNATPSLATKNFTYEELSVIYNYIFRMNQPVSENNLTLIERLVWLISQILTKLKNSHISFTQLTTADFLKLD